MVCIYVRRGDFQQYDRLHQAFSRSVPVLWDRRRHSLPSVTQRAERRQTPPVSWVQQNRADVPREERKWYG